MYLEVDCTSAPGTIALREADELRSFKLLVRGHPTRSRLAEAIDEVGVLSGDRDALVRIDAVLRLAGHHAADAEWRSSFGEMVRYARSRGWVNGDGSMLQAHCERAG